MSNADQSARASAAARNYLLFSFAALLSMVPVLLLKGMDLWSVLPLLLGAVSLLVHWKAGPVFVLLSLAVLVIAEAHGFDPITCLQMPVLFIVDHGGRLPITRMNFAPVTPLLDFLLSMCVLAFLAGHYRLQALVYHVLPPEAVHEPRPAQREASKALTEQINARRAAALLPHGELSRLALAVLISALAAAYAWHKLRGLEQTGSLDLSPVAWRALTFIWSCALILLVGWAAFSYCRRGTASPEESLVYLQDQLWRQTRREQARLNRWLTWARLRERRRQEDKT